MIDSSLDSKLRSGNQNGGSLGAKSFGNTSSTPIEQVGMISDAGGMMVSGGVPMHVGGNAGCMMMSGVGAYAPLMMTPLMVVQQGAVGYGIDNAGSSAPHIISTEVSESEVMKLKEGDGERDFAFQGLGVNDALARNAGDDIVVRELESLVGAGAKSAASASATSEKTVNFSVPDRSPPSYSTSVALPLPVPRNHWDMGDAHSSYRSLREGSSGYIEKTVTTTTRGGMNNGATYQNAGLYGFMSSGGWCSRLSGCNLLRILLGLLCILGGLGLLIYCAVDTVQVYGGKDLETTSVSTVSTKKSSDSSAKAVQDELQLQEPAMAKNDTEALSITSKTNDKRDEIKYTEEMNTEQMQSSDDSEETIPMSTAEF